MSKDKFIRGTSLYLAFMITAILLAIALGISTILLSQIEMMQGMGYSVIAFYAADAGIEKVLTTQNDDPAVTLALNNYLGTFSSNGATYILKVVLGGGPGCTAINFCIKSIGTYKGTRRAIEIRY